MVIVERYALSFWRNGHEERMCSVRRRIIVMQKPRVVCPKYLFQVINTFSAFFEVFVPFINIFLRHGQITEGLLQHSERFRNSNFIPQTKFNGTSLLYKFRHCKNRKNHFQSFRKQKHNYITSDDIDMKFGTDVSNSRTNIKINDFARIGQPAKFKLKIHLTFCPQ